MSTEKRLAIVGGGLAGMSAAAAAVERGWHVELFERKKTLAGRAASFVEPKTGETVDFCQHAAMGCCTEFLDFCRRTDIDDCFTRHDVLHCIGPNGRQFDLAPSRWLPAPLHLLPSLMRLSFLTWRERRGIARAMHRLIRLDKIASSQTVCEWLLEQGQSIRAIQWFWSVVLESALSETVYRASLSAAQKVFRDGFCASRPAGDLWLPRRPLSEIFHDRLAQWLAERGVELRLGNAVRKIAGDGRRAETLMLADGARRSFDAVVVAVPWRQVRHLLDDKLAAAIPALADAERLQPAAITAVHLWFDRSVVPLPHAVLVGRLGQWVFLRSWESRVGWALPTTRSSFHETDGGQCPPYAEWVKRSAASPQCYCQVVVSASHRIPHFSGGTDWVRMVRSELASIWPAAREANLLHGRAVTHRSAVFSVTPECERLRRQFTQQTPVENLALAGDWTATGWPATMEGAVRSGRRAVEAIASR